MVLRSIIIVNISLQLNELGTQHHYIHRGNNFDIDTLLAFISERISRIVTCVSEIFTCV